jgi:hypothetical protein
MRFDGFLRILRNTERISKFPSIFRGGSEKFLIQVFRYHFKT